MKIKYIEKKFSHSARILIDHANKIIVEYEAQGYDLTLRQLYYQMVARDILPNKQAEYKRLGVIISDARLAGLVSWNAIQDLTRELRSLAHWDNPEDIVQGCANSFRIDKWAGQEFRPEVWVEKDALRNVVERICGELDVPFFACRGYVSQSEMWGTSRRFASYQRNGQTPYIIHLGDHDPSGIDMTRDIINRLNIFNTPIEVDRQALNMNQVRKYRPPPNPAKTTDSRYKSYIKSYGKNSWELDALEPKVLTAIIRKSVTALRNERKWKKAVAEENRHRKILRKAANNWTETAEFLKEL